jgi:hypothetical protein
MTNENQPNLDGLTKSGSNAAKPESAPIDLSSVGGKVIASPPTGSDPVDISHLYGEHGGLVWAAPTTKEEKFRDAGIYGETGGAVLANSSGRRDDA